MVDEKTEWMTCDDMHLELHKRENQTFLFVYKDQLSKRYKFTLNYVRDKKTGIELYKELHTFMKLFKEALDKEN